MSQKLDSKSNEGNNDLSHQHHSIMKDYSKNDLDNMAKFNSNMFNNNTNITRSPQVSDFKNKASHISSIKLDPNNKSSLS